MPPVRLGIVTTAYAGWKTVRERWESDLADYNPQIFHIENYWRPLAEFTMRFGARSVGDSLAGRAAARAAISSGVNVVLMSTLQYAPFLPIRADVTYLIYGDSTTNQLARLYGNKPLGFPGSWITSHLHAIADKAYFLCMSDWFRDALHDEFAIPQERLVTLPFYVDAERWTPAVRRNDDKFRVVFIGGDLHRKGGDILYGLAAMDRFKDVEFHIVSPQAVKGGNNIHIHRQLTPDSDELIRLVQNSHVMVLPTRADMSPLAAMEASACKVPVIITRVAGIPEIVVDQVTGSTLAAPDIALFAEELARYRDNPALVETRGAQARAHVEKNYSKLGHMRVLRNLIATAAPGARH